MGYGTVLFKLGFAVRETFLSIPVFLLHMVGPKIAEIYQHCQDENSFSQ